MKKLKVTLCALLVLFCGMFFVACSEEEVKNFNIEQIKLVGTQVRYDGNSHIFQIEYGDVDLNVTYSLDKVVYKTADNFSFVNAGAYDVYYKISANGYNTYSSESSERLIIMPRNANVIVDDVVISRSDEISEINPAYRVEGLIEGDSLDLSFSIGKNTVTGADYIAGVSPAGSTFNIDGAEVVPNLNYKVHFLNSGKVLLKDYCGVYDANGELIKYVNNLTEAFSYVEENSVIKLYSDIKPMARQIGGINLVANDRDYKFTIDLNGHTIEPQLKFSNYNGTDYADYGIDVSIIDSTEEKAGRIGSESSPCAVVVAGDSKVNLELNSVTCVGANYSVYYEENCEGSTISVTDCKLYGDVVAVYLPGNGEYNFTNCYFEGQTAYYAKSGTHNLNNCEFVATSETYNEAVSGSVVTATGSAVVVDSAEGYTAPMVVNIHGGKFSSLAGYCIEECSTGTQGNENCYSVINLDGNYTFTSYGENKTRPIYTENDRIAVDGEHIHLFNNNFIYDYDESGMYCKYEVCELCNERGQKTPIIKNFEEEQIKVLNSQVTYDGKYHIFDVEYEDVDIDVKYSLDNITFNSAENFKLKDAGTYNLYYRISAKGYNTYTSTETVSLVVSPKDIVVTVNDVTICKTDSINEINPTYTVDGLVAGDTLNLGFSIGKNIQTGADYIVGVSASGSNYNIISEEIVKNNNYNITFENGKVMLKDYFGIYNSNEENIAYTNNLIEAYSYLQQDAVIRLYSDIISKTGEYIGDVRLTADKDYKFTIDLNGHVIESELDFVNHDGSKYTGYGIDVSIIDSSEEKTGVVGCKDAWCSVLIKGDEKIDVKLDSVTCVGTYYTLYYNGSFAGSKITATNCKLYGDDLSVYLPGKGEYNFTNCYFEGKTAYYAKSGTHNLNNCEFVATNETYIEPQANRNGAYKTGSAVVIDSAEGYKRPMIVNIYGGKFSSVAGYCVEEFATSKQETAYCYSVINLEGSYSFLSYGDDKARPIYSQNNRIAVDGAHIHLFDSKTVYDFDENGTYCKFIVCETCNEKGTKTELVAGVEVTTAVLGGTGVTEIKNDANFTLGMTFDEAVEKLNERCASGNNTAFVKTTINSVDKPGLPLTGNIKLTKDIIIGYNGNSTLNFLITDEVTIDLNGYTITQQCGTDGVSGYGLFVVQKGGKLNIIDSSVAKTGAINAVMTAIQTNTDAEVNICGGTIKCGAMMTTADVSEEYFCVWTIATNGGTVNLYGGKVETVAEREVRGGEPFTATQYNYTFASYGSGTFNIYNGEVVGDYGDGVQELVNDLRA